MTQRRRRAAAVIISACLLAGCAGSETESSDATATDPTGATDTTQSGGVLACWKTVADEYKAASDQAILILRDGFSRLLGAHRSFARALNAGDADGTRKALNRFIGEARSVTDASADFEQERSMALADESQCAAEETSGANAVAACWTEVGEAYGRSASQAERALDKPMARVLFGLQEVIAAGNEGDVAGVFRANRTLAKGLRAVIPQAGRFARLAGAAAAQGDQCEG